MAEEFSPEERLLRLIRGKKKDETKTAPGKAGSPSEVPLTAGTQNMKYSRPCGNSVSGGWGYFEFFNLALVIILAAIIMFYIFDIAGSGLGRPAAGGLHGTDIASRRPRPAISMPQDANIEEETVPFPTYAEAIGRRKLFKPPKAEVVKTKEKPSTQKTESASDKLKNLSLIGIMGGERPQAIIEDKKDKKTYFLNKGQTISGMKVDDISQDRIILDFDGEKVELVL
jgi:hypothetical protein